MVRTQTPFSRLRIEMLEDRAVPAVLFVDDDLAQIPFAAHKSIQAAVNAAHKKDTIVVAPGLYREQVTVPANMDGLTIRAQQTGLAVIEVPAVTTGDSLVLIDGADDVTLRGFTIRGPLNAGGSIVYGVAVDGGSATIANNTITDIRNNPTDGAQIGVGILVYGVCDRACADIRDNTLTGYQKAGIVVYGKKASAEVERNSLDGGGPTAVIAKNGVQISGGATGEIEDNTIVGHRYTGSGYVSAGISVDDTSGVEIEGNALSGNDAGAYVSNSTRVEIEDNRAFANGTGLFVIDSTRVEIEGNLVWSNTDDGIGLVNVSGGEVEGNRVWGNGADGVYLVGSTRIEVSKNRITGNGRDGLNVSADSKNNTISGNTLRDNVRFDADDDSTGHRTGGTANRWQCNLIGVKNRPGLR